MNSGQESQVRIMIHCPQCGGDIDFLEEAHVIRCRFCDSSLLVAGREGVLRYVLPPKVPTPQAATARALESLKEAGKLSPRVLQAFLFYAPFWRMRGTVFRWVFGLKPMKVEVQEVMAGVPPPMDRVKVLLTRVLDHTIAGYTGPEIGLTTLGVRAQAMRLQPLGREHLEERHSLFPLEISLEQVQAEAETYANIFFEGKDLVPEVILHRLVGRVFSVVYFPIWCVEYQSAKGGEFALLDAVGGRLIGYLPDASGIQQKLSGEESRKTFEFSEIRFLPFRCPNCGWQFPFRPLSSLHFCPSCRRLFRERNGEWVEIAYGVISPSAAQPMEKLLWVPFWRWRTVLESKGERMENMAGFYQLAPPLRVVNPEKEARRPIFFYLPAVKFRNPQVIHTLASRLTYIQPEIQPISFPDGSHPLTAGGSLPETDAREMGPVILGALIPPANRKAREWLKGCRIELQNPEIFYFPFAQADILWKELSTGISFQRNVLPEDPSTSQNP